MLIVVGVALDLVEKLNAQLVMRNYEGFMKGGGGGSGVWRRRELAMRRVLILLGPPGAGKGTQAERLCAERRAPARLDRRPVPREPRAAAREMGAARAATSWTAGELVPDDVVLEMLRERVAQADCATGYLLDGFPRTLPQAAALDELVLQQEGRVRALLLEVPDEMLVERITGRRLCRLDSCTHPPHALLAAARRRHAATPAGASSTSATTTGPRWCADRLEVYRRQTAR